MSEMFSASWMQSFKQAWNNDKDLTGELQKIGFNSTIAYGLDGEAQPRGVIVVENGQVSHADAYNGEEVNWDLRTSADLWNKWFSEPPGMMALGMAYTTRKLKFEKGDYASMIKDPRMAGPFIRSFIVMGKVA